MAFCRASLVRLFVGVAYSLAVPMFVSSKAASVGLHPKTLLFRLKEKS
jgi:hypothetical protein